MVHAAMIFGLWTCVGVGPSESIDLAARADGVRLVAGYVLAMGDGDGRSLRDRLGHDADAELALRRSVAAVCRFSQVRRVARGGARVTVEVDLADLRRSVSGDGGVAFPAALLDAFGEGAVVGVGAVSPGSADRAEGAPPGWENTTSRGLGLAGRAARSDSVRALATRLDELLGGDVVEKIVPQLAELARFGDPAYDPSQVCIVKAHIRAGEVLRAAGVEADDAILAEGVVEAAGYGMAPVLCTYRVRTRAYTGERPAWSVRRLVATGQGADDDVEKARRAAHIDATLKLAREIDALPLPRALFEPAAALADGDTLRLFIQAHGDADDVWSAALRSTRVTGVTRDASTTTLTLEIELSRVWQDVVSVAE